MTRILEVYREIEDDGAEKIQTFAEIISDRIGGAATSIRWGEIPKVKILAMGGRPVAGVQDDIEALEAVADSPYNSKTIELSPREWDVWGWDLPDNLTDKIGRNERPQLQLVQRTESRGGGTRVIDPDMSDALCEVLPVNSLRSQVRMPIITGIMARIPLLGLRSDNILTRGEIARTRDAFMCDAPSLTLGPVRIDYSNTELDVANRDYGYLA